MEKLNILPIKIMNMLITCIPKNRLGFSLLVFIFISQALQLHATNIEVTDRKYLYTMNSGTPPTYTCSVTAPYFSSITASTATFKDKKVNGYLQLGIDPDVMQCYDEYRRIEVLFNVTTTTLNSWSCGNSGSADTTRTTDTYTLTIDFDPAAQKVYTEKALLLFANAYYVKAEVASVTMYDASNTVVYSGTGYSSLPQDLYWEAGIQLERYDNFNWATFPSNFEVDIDNTTDEVVFTWTTQTGASFYEIEFTHANDYSAADLSTTLTNAQVFASFVNNATRIRIPEGMTEYRIPNIFDRGYVLARIRGVGMKGSGSDGCLMQNEIAGTWSFENSPGAPFALNTMNADHYEVTGSHEGASADNKNWKMSGSYAEDGKHKEIVEYADGSSRVRQSVTRLSTTNEAIVGETMYDYQGRPTVQILPVPVMSAVVQYYDNFNVEDGSGNKFNREHFDDDAVFAGASCIPTPPELGTTSGASYYYSASNTYQTDQQAFVADAEKYPYTQVVYAPDNTGRIKMQSGVGSNHILGSGHETRYFYGKPSQEELDRLFGTNVGYQSHYQKNMVIDANGQVSISFLDMSGKTIATALAGEPPANVTALKTEDGAEDLYVASAETLDVNLLGDVTVEFPNGVDNHLSADGMIWSNTTPLLVEANGNYRFRYEVELKDYLDECLEAACFDCQYTLEINLLDACNSPVSGFPINIPLGGNTADTICNADNYFLLKDGSSNNYIDASLAIGNYTVIKTLRLDEDVIGYYTNKYIDNNTCLLDRDDFFIMPDTSGCFYSCQDCLDALGDTTSFFAANPGISLAELRIIYNSKKAGCDKICDDDGNNLCLAGYRSMLRDVTPKGQYAGYDVDVNNHPVIPVDKLSIFHDDPYLPDHTDFSSTPIGGSYPHDQIYPPQAYPWRHPHYFDKEDPNSYISISPSYADVTHEFYFEEDGQKSKIYLDQDVYGNWVPNIVGTATVYTDGTGSYVYPQDLQYMEDFISRYKDSWARSLLVYHPEFLFMKECLSVSLEVSNLDVGGTGVIKYNTWKYDELLRTMNFADINDIMPTTYTNTFDLRETDPFFDYFGSISLLGTDINTLYTNRADNFVTFTIPTTEILNIHQVTYLTNRCPLANPAFNVNPVPACAPVLATASNNDDYILNALDFEKLVSTYIALKQEFLLRYLHLKVRSDHASTLQNITNQCIGCIGYDVESRPHTLDPWMPCDLVEYTRYANKQVRFGLPEAIYNNGAFNPAPPTPEQLLAYGQQQVYEATGICPAGIDLQTLIYGLEDEGDLTAVGLDLDNYSYLMAMLRTKIEADNAGSVPNYTGSISGQVLTGVTGTNSFTLTLPVGYNWGDVEMFANIDDIFLTLGDFTFTIQAQVLNTVTGNMDWVELAGWTNLQIGDCETEIPKLCKVTQEAKDLKKLMTRLKMDAVINSTVTTTTIGTTYSAYITPVLRQYLGGGTPGNYQWTNPSSGVYRLTNTSTTKYIVININPGDISTFNSSYTMYSINGDIDVSPVVASTSGFALAGYTDMDNEFLGALPDIKVEGYMTSGPGVNPFRISECDEPPPGDCQTTEHHHYFEFLDELKTMQPYPSNACVSGVTKNGVPGWFPTSNPYTILELKPDLDYSTDLVTSNHFIVVILETGETEPDTMRGTYCKFFQECVECDTLVAEPPCDGLYFTATFPVSGTGIAYISATTLSFAPPDGLQRCYDDYMSYLTFSIGSLLPAGTYNVEYVLEEWEQRINDNCDGYITAHHPAGTNIITFQFHYLEKTSCECSVKEGTIGIRINQTKTYNADVAQVCCEDFEELEGYAAEMMFLVEDEDSSYWEPQVPLTITGPCDINLTPFPVLPPTTNPCVQALLAAANLNADNAYEKYLDSVRAAFRADYIATCMEVTEDFRVEFLNQQYHFTLYYYDQAGNLVKTVPPKAVRPIALVDLGNVTTNRNAVTAYVPEHDQVNGNDYENLTTKYIYNTLNQPRYQKTPDGGETEFIYDALGRLALSQNAKQAVSASPDYQYSYTTYDPLGRITEVGQLEATSTMSQDNALVSISAVPTYIALTNSTHTQITSTVYDEAFTGNPGIVQTQLRNRVSYTTYRDAYADPARSAAYYSYDIHGNVQTFWQENTDIPDPDHQVKKIEYSYDLVSGKVNQVTYQRAAQDQWIHRYAYDADNRLTLVETSRNDVFYDRDASYFYYKHGPLARTELGELNVQGMDYTYTIHGWLKAVNGMMLLPYRDMGHDGYTGTHQYFAQDVYGYALHYYDDDYKNISNNPGMTGNFINITYTNLYNGNIGAMETSIKDNAGLTLPLLSRYTYDQLNRLFEAEYNADLNTLSTDKWNNTFDNRYHNEFRYDANGNITVQVRNGTQADPNMDDLGYNYIPGTNRLEYVEDQITSTYTDDIDNQSSGNYGYDAIGNLVRDNAEEIDTIDWTVYGKVKSVTRVGGSTRQDLEFAYGPGGQRITKRHIQHGGSNYKNSYYFYDASGNMMGIYTIDEKEDILYLEEQVMYGSSRLGNTILHEELNLSPADPVIYTQERGKKRYELNNHLGNVLTTISDRRVLNCTTQVYFADIINVSDYSPFGAPLAERTWTKAGDESYRFGFNGKEKLDEFNGDGNIYDYGFRIFDPRIGRFLSRDPLSASYPWFTPYQFASNDPIRNSDIDGLEGISEIEYLMNMAAQSLGIPSAPQTQAPLRPAGEPLNSNTKAVASLIPNEPAPPANNNSNDKPVLNNPSARDVIVTAQTNNTPQQGDPLVSSEILPTASGTIQYGRYHGRPGNKHQGVDLKADVGTPIYAPYDGKFTHKIILSHKQGVWFDKDYINGLKAAGKDHNDGGNRIYLISTVDDNTIKTAYFHISQIAINPQTGKNYELGDEVKQGDIIGYTGSTGSANGPGSGGPHLHYEMWFNGVQVNPEEYMKTKYDKKSGKPLTVQ